MNDEFLDREKLREDEVTKFKLALEEAAEQQQRTFEIDMTKTRQELENAAQARNAKLKETLLEKDKFREDECTALKLELEAKYLKSYLFRLYSFISSPLLSHFFFPFEIC